jgi:hypothetical protein
MNRQKRGNDAETWDPIHLRLKGRPGISPAVMRDICTRSVSSTIEAAVQFPCCTAGQVMPALLNAAMAVIDLKPA